jgi:hypothetical protein
MLKEKLPDPGFNYKKTCPFGPGQRQLVTLRRGPTGIQNSGARIQKKVFAFGSNGKYYLN